ncbi:MAG: nicotinate phosphoribosyltransferase [bacterium]|nr:nicotinate phosphoribosyltransferase [bacterium]
MKAAQPWCRREGLALLTDLYELTMAAGYLKEGRASQRVCFEYFFRSLPHHAGFAVSAGLEPFLDYLENLRFGEDDLEYLRSLNLFDESFFAFLRDFRPQCTVRAMPEGTLVFPHEPLVQVEGSIIEAQIIETALLNMLNYQTLIATKASRVCLAAEGEPVLEFGLRRAHGPDGGMSGSRAAYIGGCESTSNVLAGKVYGIPVAGTHAHSWVMSFESELEAFRAFARHYPDRCVLLVDTYDTLGSGVPNAIRVFKEMREAGHSVRPAIRLDSGDLAKLSKAAHAMMTEAGFDDPLIVASNDLHEDLIADLKRQRAKINAWGVGTSLITSYNCPALSGVYKLVAVAADGAWMPRMKTTSNVEKSTDPARKQVVRYVDEAGHPLGDVLYAFDEDAPTQGDIRGHHRTQAHVRTRLRNAAGSEALMDTVFADGCRTNPSPPIADIRGRAQRQIASLPDEFTRLRNPEIYRVILSESIGHMKEKLIENPDQW